RNRAAPASRSPGRDRCNAAGVPIAAGVLYPVLGLLLSAINGAATSLSSVSVVGNSRTLRVRPTLRVVGRSGAAANWRHAVGHGGLVRQHPLRYSYAPRLTAEDVMPFFPSLPANAGISELYTLNPETR